MAVMVDDSVDEDVLLWLRRREDQVDILVRRLEHVALNYKLY